MKLSYRELQASAKALGIAANQSADALREAIAAAEGSADDDAVAGGSIHRFVTYNLLSAPLARAAWFPKADSNVMDEKPRFERLKAKLDDVIREGWAGGPSPSPPILALQEVSLRWVGPLTQWFNERGYTLVRPCTAAPPLTSAVSDLPHPARARTDARRRADATAIRSSRIHRTPARSASPFFSHTAQLSTHYGNHWNDYMGVAIAFSHEHYEIVSSDVAQVSSTVRWKRAPKPAEPSAIVAHARSLYDLVVVVLAALTLSTLWRPLLALVRSKLCPAGGENAVCEPGAGTRAREGDAFKAAQRRWNRSVYLHLRPKGAAKKSAEHVGFGVATYHMPCLWWDNRVMAIHAALVAQHVHKLATKSHKTSGALLHAPSQPVVLMGDFNFKATSGSYELLTTGALPTTHFHYPTPPSHETKWTPTLEAGAAFVSAYVAANGAEPEVTNVAFSGSPPTPFADCIDYIFTTPEKWEVRDVLPLATRASFTDGTTDEIVPEKACPNADEPSDHMMLGATLALRPLAQEE